MIRLLAIAGFLSAPLQAAELGPQPDGASMVATRQQVRPVGSAVQFSGRPVNMVLSPDGAALYIKDNRGLVVVDTGTWQVAQELGMDEKFGGSMHGIAVSADGSNVYLTSAQNRLYVAGKAADGKWGWTGRIPLPGPREEDDPSHACGIALSGDGATAYVCLSRNNAIAVVDLAAGAVTKTIDTGVAPFDVALSPDGGTAYVSNWGGRRPREGDETAKSSGSPVVVDARGIGASGTVGFIDLAGGAMVAELEVGLHPSDLALHPDGTGLYVANANSDTVSVIDPISGQVVATHSTRPVAGLPFGSAPNAVELDAASNTMYVANGGNNAVAVMDATSGAMKGQIPAGWYPGALALREGQLYIANIKGIGSRTRMEEGKGWHVKWYSGTVNKVALPDESTLAEWTAQANADARVPESLRAWEHEEARKDMAPVPVPERTGEPSVFEHVVYIIKENRTYDQVLGDMKQGNGEPKLCIYPREITPNHHALAEEFVLLDNYYCNGVLSADGHSWATEGYVTDHLEKSFGGFTRSYTYGDDSLTYSSGGFIWDGVLAKGLSFRNYGEFDDATILPLDATFSDVWRFRETGEGNIRFIQKIGLETMRTYACADYPGWNMKIPDMLRADVFIREFERYKKEGGFPNFTIIFLPQDHTSGTKEGMPTPRAHLADNDLTLGRIVEAISHSDYWPRTVIFSIEDDPQDGFDHVDGHRSICLVASPYTKRGEVVSELYNQTSVLHTIGRIFGLPPMNQIDAQSTLMTECFTSTPDLTPYQHKPSNVPLDELNPPVEQLAGAAKRWATLSAQMNLDQVDQADEDTMNRILWHAAMGVGEKYPRKYAGAHGRGLKGLGLERDRQAGEAED